MPKLRRVRLVSIGHESARFEDVVLDFTDRSGHATNSVLWLRNGGGKTSLLSLLFASVRPGQREFLGKRADEKVRALEHYVGPRDSGVVVCEWELDAENSLFGNLPLYLSGVFFERAIAHEGNGTPKVRSLYFATMVSPKVDSLSLEGLPLMTDDVTQKRRRNLNGFRLALRTLDSQHPHLGVFVSDKQHQYVQELDSRGIDSEVFRYQIMMNEREGGVSERFSFAQDDEFIDFLLQMTFSRERAQEVLDQLSTFRQALVKRNEQLKPEYEYCSGLLTRLRPLIAIQRDRQQVYERTRASHQQLMALKSLISGIESRLTESIARLDSSISDAECEIAKCRERQDLDARTAAVFDQAASRLRFDAVNAEYEQAKRDHEAAKRLREIWLAGRFLARAQQARRMETELRDQLARLLSEFAPDLERLKLAATRFCGALKFKDSALVLEEAKVSNEITQHNERSARLQLMAQEAGEAAARHEGSAEYVRQQLASAASELTRLQNAGIVLADELPAAAIRRFEAESLSLDAAVADQDRLIEAERTKIASAIERLPRAEAALLENRRQLDSYSKDFKAAEQRRTQLENDPTLHRLLQTERVDVEAALASSIAAAGKEASRVSERIARIQIEAAEERRAIAWLQGDGDLLPPSGDVLAILDWLRPRRITAWAGWEFFSRYEGVEHRTLIGRFPQIATGVVVANKDYGAATNLIATDTLPRLGTAIVLCPADALQASVEPNWIVVGPSSDAHFDRDAAARELHRLVTAESARSKELNELADWQLGLTSLQERLRTFQGDYPIGWFAHQQQRVAVANAHYLDSEAIVAEIKGNIGAAEVKLNAARERHHQLHSSQTARQERLERVRDYERQHGSRVAGLTQELAEVERDIKLRRTEQQRYTQQIQESGTRLEMAQRRRTQFSNERTEVKLDLNQVKYVDRSAVAEEAGDIESARSSYRLLADEYERKVNADGLKQIADAKGRDAEAEEREFRRVLAGLSSIQERDVEDELGRLPVGASAEVRAEEAEREANEAVRRLGPLENRRRPVQQRFEAATTRCLELSQSGGLPVVELSTDAEQNEAAAEKFRASAREQDELTAEFEAETQKLRSELSDARHKKASLEKDCDRLQSIESNYELEFQRVPMLETPVLSSVLPAVDMNEVDRLGAAISSIESDLRTQRHTHSSLDMNRDAAADEIGNLSRQDRFVKLTHSVASQFAAKRGPLLESKADLYSRELDDRIVEIERELAEANQHHDRVVNIVLSAVDEALNLLNRVSRMSKVPDSLPQAGKQFLLIESNASDNPTERRVKVGDLIDELLETGNIGDGLNLLQKALRRVTVRTKVRILHPDLKHSTKRMSIAAMRQLSGGERLTCAVLLFCALVRLRQREGSRRGSSVLILDNPIGTASRLSFLDLQREVARSMNVQLIYATGVKDLNAIGALENVIRLRNSRVDRRSGRRVVELDDAERPGGELRAARVVFDHPPSSSVSPESEALDYPESETSDDAVGD